MPPQIYLRSNTPPALFTSLTWSPIFNHLRDTSSRVPFAICYATTPSDIIACIDLARTHNRQISIRSGGHSWAAWSVRDDAILVDLRGLYSGEFTYDKTTGVVVAPAGRTGKELNEFLQNLPINVEGGGVKHEKRMFQGGHCPDVGLGGFLLQGGMGWCCKVCSSSPCGT